MGSRGAPGSSVGLRELDGGRVASQRLRVEEFLAMGLEIRVIVKLLVMPADCGDWGVMVQ